MFPQQEEHFPNCVQDAVSEGAFAGKVRPCRTVGTLLGLVAVFPLNRPLSGFHNS